MITRRTVLRGGAAAAVLTGISLRTAQAEAGTANPIVEAYRQLQVGIDRPSPERTAALANLGRVAKSYNDSMSLDGPLWTDLPFGPGSDYTTSMYGRLRAIAVDWGTPGATLGADPAVLDRVKQALELLYTNQYNENTSELGNWYTYEIGIPYYLLHTLATVADQLDPADLERYVRPVKRFVGDPNRRANNANTVETGANRADKALIAIVAGALIGDDAWLRRGIDALTDVEGGGQDSVLAKLDRAAGDGFHTDGSFLQHGTIPYPGHYGIVLLTALAGAIHVTDGTSFALPDDLKDQVYALVPDTFAPFVVGGALMEPVRGRMLSRQGETAHDIGHQLTVATTVLARTATGDRRAELSGLVAKWIDEGTYAPFLEIPDPERFAPGPDLVATPGIELAQELLAAKPPRTPTVAMHRVFGQQDRMVHTTPDWSSALGLGSTRISRYESINGMNLHGWYTGDGVLYTFLANDRGHYSDAYWPTVDPLLLPGTTTKTGDPGPLGSTPMGATPHSGGVRHDDRHGAYALDFVSADGTLTAKKSWFFTPHGIVCLGAGITDDSGERVRTTIENRNLGEGGDPALRVDGLRVPTPLGQEITVRDKRSLHLDGVGGYRLLDHADVVALREDRTAAWRDIDTGANTKGTTVPYTRRYQKLILDHGVRPANASYAYAVLPGTSFVDAAVRANTATVQAVRLSNGVLLANFFAACAVDGVTVSGPISLAYDRGRRRLAIADPTQQQNSVRVGVRGHTVSVPLAGTFGATRTVVLGR